MYSKRKVAFYQNIIKEKLQKGFPSLVEKMVYENKNAVVKNHLASYIDTQPIIALWSGQDLWTIVSGEEVVSQHDGMLHRIYLDDIGRKINNPPCLSSADGSKFTFTQLFLGVKKISIWAPSGEIMFALMNILQRFPLRFNE